MLSTDLYSTQNLFAAVSSRIRITDCYNTYNNNEKFEILEEVPKCDTET